MYKIISIHARQTKTAPNNVPNSHLPQCLAPLDPEPSKQRTYRHMLTTRAEAALAIMQTLSDVR